MGVLTAANRMVIFPKLKKIFFMVKTAVFLAKTPFLGRKINFSFLSGKWLDRGFRRLRINWLYSERSKTSS